MKFTKLIMMLVISSGVLLMACQSAPVPEVTLVYHENAQFELSAPNGARVLMDIYDPNLLTAPPTANDVLVTTHGHADHFDQDFVDNFPGEQLFIQEGEITTERVSIVGIAAAHTAYGSDEIKPQDGSNYIYVVELNGFRIAHFGDIGQEALTTEQLEQLGQIDIAIMQFVNSFSQMDMNNEKGFNLIQQVNPKLIIPTHGNGNMNAIEHSVELWDTSVALENSITVSSDDFVDNTKFVIMGVATESLQAIFELPVWGE